MNAALLEFFDSCPAALPLYEAVEQAIFQKVPAASLVVHKTQIDFKDKRAFAYVSLPFRRTKAMPKVCIIVSFGLAYRVEDERIFQAANPRPNRWTHHVIVASPIEVDDTLLGWIMESHAFAQR